jgi:hypothetical protein
MDEALPGTAHKRRGRPSRSEVEAAEARSEAMMEEQAVPFTETAEFKAAVQAAVQTAVPQAAAEAVAAAMAQMRAAAPQSVPAAGTPADASATSSLFREMALAIAEISDQGTDRKRVAPEVLEQRAQAQKRLDQLLEDARVRARAVTTNAESRKVLPWYRCVSMLYLNERKILPFVQDPGTKQAVPVEFSWTGEPNDAMRPINDVAKEVYREFRLSRGNIEKVKGSYETKPLWMTKAGLVVHGDAPSSAANGRGAQTIEVAEYKDDLEFGGMPAGSDPNADFVNILGTIHAPAMQNKAP